MDELEQLVGQAAELDAEAAAATGAGPDPSTEPEPQPEPKLTTAQQLAAILEMVRGIAKARDFHRTVKALDEESINALAQALAPVLDKYGLSPSGMFGRWKEEALAAMVCLPIVWSVTVAMRMDLEERAAAAAKPVQAEPAHDSTPG